MNFLMASDGSDEHKIVRINVDGDLTPERSEENPLGEQFGQSIYGRRVLLNMANSPFTNSPGLGWLLINNDRFSKGGGRCVAHSMPPGVLQALKLMRLDRKLLIAATEAEAIAKLMEGGK